MNLPIEKILSDVAACEDGFPWEPVVMDVCCHCKALVAEVEDLQQKYLEIQDWLQRQKS